MENEKAILSDHSSSSVILLIQSDMLDPQKNGMSFLRGIKQVNLRYYGRYTNGTNNGGSGLVTKGEFVTMLFIGKSKFNVASNKHLITKDL